MPRFDGSGPQGCGPGTGRRMGPCFKQGRKYFSRKEEADILKEEIEELKKEIDGAKERLSEIEDK